MTVGATAGAAGPVHRPEFHLTAERGRLNDPNGLIRLGELWHVFYQIDPSFPETPPHTGWGYATSADLLTWHHHPQALYPDRPYDAAGCFSGSAVAPQSPGGPVELFYTGNVPAPARFTGDVWGATQNLAVADVMADGSLSTPVKDPGNPLISGPPPGFTAHWRDPIVSEDPDHPGRWRMLLGARTDDDRGTALLHFSNDRRSWDDGRELLVDGPSPGGYIWECPNLLRMSDAATGGQADVLILSPQGIRADAGDTLRNRYQCGYLVGHLRGRTFRVTTEFTELDHGFEFYAPQVFAGTGSAPPVMLGWMGMPEEDDHPTVAAEGWLHCLTVARELSLYDGHLHQSPVLPASDVLPAAGDGHVGDIFRVRLEGDGVIELTSDGLVTVELAGSRVTVSRRTVGVPSPFGNQRATTLRDRAAAAHCLDIIVDRSAIEIVADDGAAVFSLRAFSGDGTWAVSAGR